MKNFAWPTWEELEAEKIARWNNLPSELKITAVNDWREFALSILFSDMTISRKKLKKSIYGKN